MSSPRELSDSARLAALAQTALMDSPSEEAFDRLTQLACRVLQVPIVLLSLVDENRQFFKSAVGLNEPWATERQTPLSHSVCQYVVRSGDELRVEDIREDDLLKDNLALSELEVVSYAGVPIRSRSGFVLGSFCAADHQPRVWQEADMLLLNDLSAAVTTEIELRAAIAEALHLATHDPLSGLSNRAHFMECLEIFLARAARDNSSVALLFLDLDGFKQINDRLGHLLGDRLLIEVGDRLRGCVRIQDMVARFGGDEFTILLGDLPPGSEKGIAERVAHAIEQKMRQPFALDDQTATVTFSIGGAISTTGEVSTDDLLRRADQAMYQAKQSRQRYYLAL